MKGAAIMAVHWVNYDLRKPGQNYEGLITYLKSHASWAKPLKSSFFVKTSLSAAQLRDGILNYIDSGDAVVVVQVEGRSWASYGVPKEVGDWMRTNL